MRAARQPTVYILASRPNGTLYVGVTSDLAKRLEQHRAATVEGFTRKYGVDRLVHVEHFETMVDAIAREKRLKKWNRAWKLRLIEQHNPMWRDLAEFIDG
jgi:putative endonuclease